jgi:1-acyl-sn-glycerol-3-phosphate acyltransferase
VFHPPRYTPWLAAFFGWFSRHFILKRKFKVVGFSTEGGERVAELAAAGAPVLIAPNHADHADPSVLLRAAREHGFALHFMAAREGFEGRRISAFALQRTGAFSVDREGADVASIKTAMRILSEGRFPLVMFPEGEIYHHHETLDELNEGVATIVLRVAARLDAGRSAYVVPTAIRYVHDPAVAETFSGRLDRLEERVTWKPRPHVDVVERIYRLGSGLLALKEEEFLGQRQEGDLVQRIRGLQSALVQQVEARHGGAKSPGSLPHRVKGLRNRIRKRLTDSAATLGEQETWDLYDDLDRLFVAVQLYSYPGQYLRENPTPGRIAETLLKLEEDVLGEGTYPSPTRALVRFGEPIDVQQFMAAEELDVGSAAGPLTGRIAAAIQAALQTLEPSAA